MPFWDRTDNIPYAPRIIAVLWLSFLMAGAATGVFFSAIDPMELRNCVDFPEVNRTAAYSIGFFLFWLLTASSSLLAVFFTYPADKDTGAADPSSRES